MGSHWKRWGGGRTGGSLLRHDRGRGDARCFCSAKAGARLCGGFTPQVFPKPRPVIEVNSLLRRIKTSELSTPHCRVPVKFTRCVFQRAEVAQHRFISFGQPGVTAGLGVESRCGLLFGGAGLGCAVAIIACGALRTQLSGPGSSRSLAKVPQNST